MLLRGTFDPSIPAGSESGTYNFEKLAKKCMKNVNFYPTSFQIFIRLFMFRNVSNLCIFRFLLALIRSLYALIRLLP